MSLDVNAIKKAVVAALIADSTLMGLITAVYGKNVPSSSVFPYVRYTILPSNSGGTFGTYRETTMIQFDCREAQSDDSTAQETVGNIATEVARILDNNINLNIEGYRQPCCNRVYFGTEMDNITDVEAISLVYEILAERNR